MSAGLRDDSPPEDKASYSALNGISFEVSSFSNTLHSVLSDLNPESTVICGTLADGDMYLSSDVPASTQPAPVVEEEDNDEYPSLF